MVECLCDAISRDSSPTPHTIRRETRNTEATIAIIAIRISQLHAHIIMIFTYIYIIIIH